MAESGDWLRRARRRAGYDRQEDLARDMGVERSAVSNWETDRTKPSMANAERLAVLLRRPRAEVLARFGYPIGGGDPMADLPVQPPPEWLRVIRDEIAAGVADGLRQVLEQLRSEGLLPAPDTGAARPPRRRRP